MSDGRVAQSNRRKLTYARFLVRPCALSGSQWELLFAGSCIVLLGTVFVAEAMTPDVVVGAFALVPLLAAVWVLSSRLAALVAFVAIFLLGVAVSVETANRFTVVLMGVAILLTALVARLYATSLASLLSSHRHLRPAVPTQATPATLDRIDQFSHGIRSLTRRELEVTRLGAQGYTAAEIGHHLHIGDRTVESHLASAYAKLRISSRSELIRMASRFGAQ